MKPAIVVAAYNRPEALARLLGCLAQGEYPPDVPLVISIDPGGSREAKVCAAAEAFEWRHGEKCVMRHPAHLGLVEHMHVCGSLTRQYGSIVKLEDDYLVSPMFYLYAAQALDAYQDDPRIAGVSLYQLWFNGYTYYPFTPFLDDGDAYFLQIPWSQGQVYTEAQWSAYAEWRRSAGSHIPANSPIHEVYTRFAKDDWFPLKTRYLAETNRFYAFPRESLSTNSGEPGTHFEQKTSYFQTPLQTRKREYRFVALDQAVAVYDSFLEMLPDRLSRLAPALATYDIDVDLYGAKSPQKIRKEYVLTTKACSRPILTFGDELRPLEANVAAETPGTVISLCRTHDLRGGWLARMRARKRLHDWFMGRHTTARRTRLLFWLIKYLDKLNL